MLQKKEMQEKPFDPLNEFKIQQVDTIANLASSIEESMIGTSTHARSLLDLPKKTTARKKQMNSSNLEFLEMVKAQGILGKSATEKVVFCLSCIDKPSTLVQRYFDNYLSTDEILCR
jgi:hypothetical protein